MAAGADSRGSLSLEAELSLSLVRDALGTWPCRDSALGLASRWFHYF